MQQAPLFVAVMGASSYTYAEATPDEQLASWIGAHVRAFEFFQGAPKLAVPDNTRTGVTKACRYDPDLNPTYQEMAMQYGIGVVPARPYKPRDKAKVESGVQLAERWIIAALRHRKFISIEEVNQAVRGLRDRINQRPFRKREGSRASQFAAIDKPALNPLPAEPSDLSQWSRARAGDRNERRGTTQKKPVEQARPDAIGVVHAWSLGDATPAGLAESSRSINREHQRTKRSNPAGGGETARGAAAHDASWRRRPCGSRLCADPRVSGPLWLWQADRQLSGARPLRELQRRSSAVRAH